MPKIDSEKFYTSAIEMHGTSAQGVNWASKKNQIVRFEAILKLLPPDLSAFSIADAGCGFGDLYLYMSKKKTLPKEYIGIDSLVDMYSIAAEKTGCEIIVADICRDELPVKDYYVCSGALNVLTPFETYQFIQNCYNASKYGFIFNALHGDKKSSTYNYLTKSKIIQIAKDLDVQKINFIDDYLNNDISISFSKK